ncbi:MAG: hypothetical protein IPK26_02895 [Planctomycetes bacterium]|nr:hypothetical protein [Planctomycetota bacterium]
MRTMLLSWLSLLLSPPTPLLAQALQVADLPSDAPLAITAERAELELRVHVVLQRGWHLYGKDTGNGQPVTVTLAADCGFAATGPLVTPMAANGEITGNATLTLPLRQTGAGTALAATLQFMVCDALQCLPPMTVALTSNNPPRVLLVAVDTGERTARIAAFLQARGLPTTTTTYADVTAAVCDAHDVVLADSPTFNQARGKKVPVAKFPETATPIVAVGFLGTQLLEAQRVAMACGYI